MSVVVSQQEAGPCRQELKIEVPAPAVQAETQRVVQELARKARLPGFRKGKVPRSLVRKRFRSDIDQEVLERLVPRYWRQAEAEQSLRTLMAPSIGEVELKEGEPLTFVATVEVRPEIEIDEDRDFDLPDPGTEVKEEEVAEVLERMRLDAAPWVVVDRPAARGDLVRLKLNLRDGEAGESEGSDVSTPEDSLVEGTAESVDGENREADQEVEVEVGDARVWEELSLAVTGLATGQTGEFERRPPPPQGGDEEPQEPPVQHYDLTVLEIKEKAPLELDDELAKKLGPFEDLAALREGIESQLSQEKQATRTGERERALLDQLVTRHPLDLPEGVVEQEVRGMLQEYAEGLAHRGVDVKNAGFDWDAMAEQIKPQAKQRVHSRLVLDAVAELDGIAVSQEEVEATIGALASSEKKSTVAVRQALDQSGRLSAMKQHMLRNKTIKHLLGEPDDRAPDDKALDDRAPSEEE